MKSLIKKFIKKGLITTKGVVAKNKTAKKIAIMGRNILLPGYGVINIYDYSRFAPTIAQYQKQLEEQKKFKKRPLISIVMPTYNTPLSYLEECIESVLIQSYPDWELCIADDASPNKEVVKLIRSYAAKDKRIKLVARKTNGHISEATNSAIKIAKGEFIALLDHDDVLWPNALFEVVKVINKQPDVDFIYSDEDKIDETGLIHSYPFFKPDWSPEFLESCNYITHFSCLRTELVRSVGGFRKGYEGAQDWDLFLRVSEKTDKIAHISKLLYSWRIHEDSTASETDAKPYVYEAQRKLLKDHIERSAIKASVKKAAIVQHSNIEYAVDGQPKVSVIVSGGSEAQLKKCLRSLKKNTTYPQIEFIVHTSNNKLPKQVFGKKDQYIVVKDAKNMADAYNKAAEVASGAFLIFIDGGNTIQTRNWVEMLIGDAQRQGVGAVGGKTISRDKDKILRAGIGVGIYGTYAPLLEWMPREDVHYMRGLYGQSRRNVSAVDSGCLAIGKQQFLDMGGFNTNMGDMFIVDACLKLLNKGFRNIYNPYVETVDPRNITAGDTDQKHTPQTLDLFKATWSAYIDYDPYFNRHFTRTNAQLEVK